jgi:Tfp pilus assembly protein PilV
VRFGKNREGLTLVELLMALLILMPIFVTVMFAFIKAIELSEIARNTSLAVWASKNKMTEIENDDFIDVPGYHQVSFTSTSLTGTGVTYVDSSNPNLLKVTISFSWRQKNGRIIGEDQDLDGQLDAGEDANGDNQLSSPVGWTTLIADVS